MQRRRFLLHYEYEMTYKEIGKIEHCSQQSVGRAVTARQRKDKGGDKEIPKRMTVNHTLVSLDMRVFALCSLMELHRCLSDSIRQKNRSPLGFNRKY